MPSASFLGRLVLLGQGSSESGGGKGLLGLDQVLDFLELDLLLGKLGKGLAGIGGGLVKKGRSGTVEDLAVELADAGAASGGAGAGTAAGGDYPGVQPGLKFMYSAPDWEPDDNGHAAAADVHVDLESNEKRTVVRRY